MSLNSLSLNERVTLGLFTWSDDPAYNMNNLDPLLATDLLTATRLFRLP